VWIHYFVLFINCPLILCQANVADFGDNQWVTCFQDTAEILLGQNSSYLGQLKDSVSFFILLFFLFFFTWWYMKVWPWGLASRHSEEQHIVYQFGVLFLVRLGCRHSSPRIFNEVYLWEVDSISHGVLLY